jgi:arylesterase / paraoxonase
MRLLFGIFGVAILGVLAWFFAHIIPAAGTFVSLEPVLVDRCSRVDIAPGTEDVTIDPELNAAFISAADRRDWYNDTGTAGANPKNGIYLMSLDGANVVRRVSPPMDNFLPHGISLWRGPNGEKRLFVVNHPPSGEEIVEIFDVDDNGDLSHLESISFDAMRSPNDVVAVGPRQFYATNDRGYEKGILSVLEAYLSLPFSSIVYYDGETGKGIKKGLTYANGINQSADGLTIYVAEFLKRRISIFDRDPKTGALTKRKSISVNTGPDNIEIAADGALWIAGHSKVFDFLAHAKDANHIAPSHVIRLNPRNGLKSDVFISTNGEINASSVGAVWDETLIVGAVFDGHVMVCPMLEIFLAGPDTE